MVDAGTGSKLGTAVVVVTGVCSLASIILSVITVWLQAKNYRKPLLQRYVIRILLMVPVYAAASWGSIMSLKAALFLDPLRDVYEAFTIYTFLQLLINFLGGERALIIMMHGRRPVSHLWPLNHCFPKVDISDPHTFLAMKRGILQYTWIKPVLSLANIIMKLTGTYDAGYFWEGLVYNISVSLSLYSLGMFWACMSADLKPFRPLPKFLCVKLVIFASYWQGFFLSLLQAGGAIPNDVKGYTSDSLAAAIQDALICCEMPIFAISHWYAFSWHDYADPTISSARMPIRFALRDAFGPRDLIEDTKETFRGQRYAYRYYDSGDNVLAHEESNSREARLKAGMRYARDGKGKYWLPRPGEVNARTPLLSAAESPETSRSQTPIMKAPGTTFEELDVEETRINDEDENLYQASRTLEFGDWNYPVITAHIPAGDLWYNEDPNMITTSTNRHLLHPTQKGKKRRQTDVKKRFLKGKGRSSSRSRAEAPRAPVVTDTLEGGSGSSIKSGRSQLVDISVEDTQAAEVERVRARKEGGAAWNEAQPKHFVQIYGDEDEGTDTRSGFEPSKLQEGGHHEEAIERDEIVNKQGPSRNTAVSPHDIEVDRNPWD